MSHDSTVTFHGRVGTQVELREGAVPWVMFRVGSTPSYWDPASRTRRDLETIWVSVKAWRTLAQNVADSLEVGDPVVVVGRLRQQTWTTQDGEQRVTTVIEATHVAHDLGLGVSTFRRVDRQSAAPVQQDDTVAVLAELEEQTPAA